MKPRAALALLVLLVLPSLWAGCEPGRPTLAELPRPSTPPSTQAPPPIRALPTALPLCRFEPLRAFSPSETLHDVVFYANAANQPQLMTLSADGQWQGPLTVGAEVVRECWPAGSGPDGGIWGSCRNWQLAPDGKWLAFNWGGEEGCNGPLGIAALNLSTGERRSQGGEWSSWGGIDWFRLLPDDRMVLATGGCRAGGKAWLWNLGSDQKRELGNTIGDVYWNTAGTILAVDGVPFMGGGWSSL